MQEQLVTHLEKKEDNFYFMINPYFPTKRMLKEISRNLPHLIPYYPSNQKVIAEKIKKLENFERPLVAVNGSCEAIRIFLQNYGRKVLVTVPNFNEWEIREYVPIAYDTPTEEIKKTIREEGVDTVCFCNPNNPAGYYREDIEGLAAEFPEVRFVVDISFIDFVGLIIPPLPKGKNIVLVKSLGKNYGICGVRLGYMASEDEGLIKEMTAKVPIWNINSIAEFLVDLIIKNKEEYEKSRVRIIKGTKRMHKFLKQFSFLKVYPTKANFVLVKSEKKLNFNVKCCDNKTGLDGSYYRLAYNPNYKKLKELIGEEKIGTKGEKIREDKVGGEKMREVEVKEE